MDFDIDDEQIARNKAAGLIDNNSTDESFKRFMQLYKKINDTNIDALQPTIKKYDKLMEQIAAMINSKSDKAEYVVVPKVTTPLLL